MRRLTKPLAALLALCLAPLLAQAHPLADKIPADALIYVGWQGTTALGASYDNSNLKGMIDALNLKDALAQGWAKAMKDAQAQGKADDAKLFTDLLDNLLKNPTALYIGSLDLTDPTKPLPKIALLCQMGKDAPDLAKRLAESMDKNHKESDPPSTAKAIGDFLLITIGTPEDFTSLITANGVTDLSVRAPFPLSNDKAFSAASKQVAPDSAITLYLNGETALKTLTEAAKANPQQANAQQIDQVIDALGLAAAKHAMLTGGFDGKNWSTQAFVELAPDRHGLAAFLDNKPLSDAALKSIPKDASWASVLRFDAPRLLADVRAAVATIAPARAGQINTGLLQAGNIIGIDIEHDLIANQSDEWVIYGDAALAGNSIRGLTIVNAVKDPKVAAQTFTALSDALNLTIAGRAGQNAKLITASKVGDLTLNTIEVGRISPTWTVANGKFILSLAPATAIAAASFDGKQSLADNPDFQALVKKLGVDKYSSFSFVDSPKTAAEAHGLWTRVATLINSQSKDTDPKITIPPVAKVLPFLSPSLDLYWSDDAGMHMKSIEPFPMSQIAGGASVSLGFLALPTLERRAAAANPARPVPPPTQPNTPDQPPVTPNN